MPPDRRVNMMQVSKDKTQFLYNDFLTLAGVPTPAFAYRLDSRSALAWIIDRYRMKTDKRSGAVNAPDRVDDPEYIVRLIGKVNNVSPETAKIVRDPPALGVGQEEVDLSV